MQHRKTFTPQQALLKAASYCAYQERCYSEVEEKLAEWGITGTDAGELMIKLSEQNYLNEERYAKAFAGGKFRTKKWGRNKIKQALLQNNISPYCINMGMKEIDDEVYMETLHTLAQEKLESLDETNRFAANDKTARWLIGKGFEADLVWNTIKNIK